LALVRRRAVYIDLIAGEESKPVMPPMLIENFTIESSNEVEKITAKVSKIDEETKPERLTRFM
jgi:hypothetical protein